MSIVKSFSFNDGAIRGDLFYIKHNTDCFSIIDCYLLDSDLRKDGIINEIVRESKSKSVQRFISTHPDDDHIHGIQDLWSKWKTTNFYCVANSKSPECDNLSLSKYIELRDKYSTPIVKGLSRAYLNKDGRLENGQVVHGSGIEFLWPDVNNYEFKKALGNVENNPNNICPIIKYAVKNGPSFLWLGDMETHMQSVFYESEHGKIGQVDIVFAPHHGRSSGTMPSGLLKELSPKIIVIGNAPSDTINYLDSDLTITQNLAGDILFDCHERKAVIYSQNQINNKPKCLAYNYEDACRPTCSLKYMGTLDL